MVSECTTAPSVQERPPSGGEHLQETDHPPGELPAGRDPTLTGGDSLWSSRSRTGTSPEVSRSAGGRKRFGYTVRLRKELCSQRRLGSRTPTKEIRFFSTHNPYIDAESYAQFSEENAQVVCIFVAEVSSHKYKFSRLRPIYPTQTHMPHSVCPLCCGDTSNLYSVFIICVSELTRQHFETSSSTWYE